MGFLPGADWGADEARFDRPPGRRAESRRCRASSCLVLCGSEQSAGIVELSDDLRPYLQVTRA